MKHYDLIAILYRESIRCKEGDHKPDRNESSITWEFSENKSNFIHNLLRESRKLDTKRWKIIGHDTFFSVKYTTDIVLIEKAVKVGKNLQYLPRKTEISNKNLCTETFLQGSGSVSKRINSFAGDNLVVNKIFFSEYPGTFNQGSEEMNDMNDMKIDNIIDTSVTINDKVVIRARGNQFTFDVPNTDKSKAKNAILTLNKAAKILEDEYNDISVSLKESMPMFMTEEYNTNMENIKTCVKRINSITQ